jgi:hypothetical protein
VRNWPPFVLVEKMFQYVSISADSMRGGAMLSVEEGVVGIRKATGGRIDVPAVGFSRVYWRHRSCEREPRRMEIECVFG